MVIFKRENGLKTLDILQMRLNANESIKNWAYRLGVDVVTIYRWERDGLIPTPEIMAQVARKLHAQGQRIMPSERWLAFYFLQRKAISMVASAIKKGNLPKPTVLLCVDCGSDAHEYDHRDYTQPLKVDAVCRKCNRKRGFAIYTLLNFSVGSR